jgi:hypothetical protein
MTFIKKYSSLIILTLSLGLFNTASLAEESQAPGISEIISHLNSALPFLKNGDVANATTHIKFARRISNRMTGDSPDLKAAQNTLFNALKHSKEGDPEKSAEKINSAIELFQKL